MSKGEILVGALARERRINVPVRRRRAEPGRVGWLPRYVLCMDGTDYL